MISWKFWETLLRFEIRKENSFNYHNIVLMKVIIYIDLQALLIQTKLIYYAKEEIIFLDKLTLCEDDYVMDLLSEDRPKFFFSQTLNLNFLFRLINVIECFINNFDVSDSTTSVLSIYGSIFMQKGKKIEIDDTRNYLLPWHLFPR